MAEEEQSEGIEETPAELLKSLENKAVANKFLFIAVLCFSVIVFTVMATGLTVIYLQTTELSAAAAEQQELPYEEQLLTLEHQLMLLSDFRKSELKEITAYTQQLATIGKECSVEQAAPYREFLLSREQDYQVFLTEMLNGLTNLAKMNKGSRQWLEGLGAQIQELKDKSSARQSSLEQL